MYHETSLLQMSSTQNPLRDLAYMLIAKADKISRYFLDVTFHLSKMTINLHYVLSFQIISLTLPLKLEYMYHESNLIKIIRGHDNS